MGADARMFPEPWSRLPGFVAHDWPRCRNAKTIREIAAVVCEAWSVRDGDSLVGASLGGIVACEIAKMRRLERVYLAGSATSPARINPVLSMLHPLAGVIPFRWVQLSASAIPGEIARMFASCEAGFVRTMCGAVFAWDGVEETDLPVVRIHGRRDLVIPPPPRADLMLDGGHVITMSHARECVEFIRNRGSLPCAPKPFV